MPFRLRKKEVVGMVAVLLGVYYLERRKKRKRRWWVRPINRNRRQQGDFHNLVQEMRLTDTEMFFNYTRLNVEQFDNLLTLLGPVIVIKSYRESISPGARLSLTLRHVAAGDIIPTLAFSYRIGKSTACGIINETCDAIWEVLSAKVLEVPDENGWTQISKGFENTWNLPRCVGAIDGKHVAIRAPHNSGSIYYNYKKHFSIVLFAICDHNYCFTYVDIGAYGSQSDGGVLRESSFGYKLNNNLLRIPPDKSFPGQTRPAPYYSVGDEAFPLQTNLMRPYGGKLLPLPQRIFNYRLSRARRCIENAFGIMVARFRIFHTTIHKHPQKVDKLVKACVVLRNYIKKYESHMPFSQRRYCQTSYDDKDVDGNLIPGEWRDDIPSTPALQPLQHLARRVGTRNAKQNALNYRYYILRYVNSDIGSVPWQYETVNK